MEFLCEHGGNVDIHRAANDGLIPFHAVSKNDHREVMEFLHTIDLSIQNDPESPS
jgi:hypothetical protein